MALTNDSVVRRAKELLEGVTPGPWESSDDGVEITVGAASYLQDPGAYSTTDLIIEYHVYGLDEPARDQRARDARFIAGARALVPELIAENEKLRAQWTTATRATQETVGAAHPSGAAAEQDRERHRPQWPAGDLDGGQ